MVTELPCASPVPRTSQWGFPGQQGLRPHPASVCSLVQVPHVPCRPVLIRVDGKPRFCGAWEAETAGAPGAEGLLCGQQVAGTVSWGFASGLWTRWRVGLKYTLRSGGAVGVTWLVSSSLGGWTKREEADCVCIRPWTWHPFPKISSSTDHTLKHGG